MLCTANRPVWHSPAVLKQRSRPLQAFANPYKVLQVSEDADPSQIKRAYRKLALKHHPDISDHPSAEEKFVRIQQAYEMLSDRKTAAQADPAGKGWDFHDWYWDFMSSSRWNSQWKKHGQAGPSPFAATPSHRDQWQAQLGRLKQKAAFRRAKQQAQQQTQPTAQQESHPTSECSVPQQAEGASSDSQHASTQESVLEHEQSDGAASTSNSSNLTQRVSSSQQSDDSEYHQAQVCVDRPDDLDCSISGDHHISHDAMLKQSDLEAGLPQNMPQQAARHDALEQPEHLLSGNVAHSPSQKLEPAEGRECTNEHNVHDHSTAPSGPVTYSYTAEESSNTSTERVHSQLMGLRRRAARKEQA